MKFFAQHFHPEPELQSDFPIAYHEEERSLCANCLYFYQGAYACLRCKREVHKSDFSLEEQANHMVDDCPHCHQPFQDEASHVAAYCRVCQHSGDGGWLRPSSVRIIGVIAERDFELCAKVACVTPTETMNGQQRYFSVAHFEGMDFVIRAKSGYSENNQSGAPHLLNRTGYIWLDAESQESLNLIRKIDGFVREWLIDAEKIKSVRTAIWQPSLDLMTTNWLAAQFDEVFYGVLPETALNLPIGGVPLSELLKKRGF